MFALNVAFKAANHQFNKALKIARYAGWDLRVATRPSGPLAKR